MNILTRLRSRFSWRADACLIAAAGLAVAGIATADLAHSPARPASIHLAADQVGDPGSGIAGIACAAPSTASATAQAAVNAACSQVGVWYSWGGGHGATPGATYGHYDVQMPATVDDGNRTGFDCSGLIRYAYYRATGTDVLNGTADDQFHTPQASARFTAAQGTTPLLPGDLMFWGTGHIHHVAMYIGNGQMVEAYESGTRIRVTPARTGGDYAGAIRISAAPGTPPAPPANAGSTFQTWGTDVLTHAAPDTGAPTVDHFADPTQVSVQCQQHAQQVTADGYTNDAWAKLSDGSWMTIIYIQGPAWLPQVPTC